jgi:hypothetical protein
MAKPTTPPRAFPVGTLPRAIADAAARVARGEHVAPGDLGGARKPARAAPAPVEPSEARA